LSFSFFVFIFVFICLLLPARYYGSPGVGEKRNQNESGDSSPHSKKPPWRHSLSRLTWTVARCSAMERSRLDFPFQHAGRRQQMGPARGRSKAVVGAILVGCLGLLIPSISPAQMPGPQPPGHRPPAERPGDHKTTYNDTTGGSTTQPTTPDPYAGQIFCPV